MVTVSDAWKAKQLQRIVPESFLEISYLITQEGLQERASASSTDEAVFSSTSSVVEEHAVAKRYATNELNLWALDGSRTLLPQADPNNTGYVSNGLEAGSLVIRLSAVQMEPIIGVTIRWCEEFGEYPTDFTVTAYRSDGVATSGGDEIILSDGSSLVISSGSAVAAKTITGNTDVETIVEMELANFDFLVISVAGWSLPQHRARIESVVLGATITFTKRDIMSYSHSQTGCLLSGELPKNSITFSLDNSDDKWNPNNPQGLIKYLAERQKITVRYGLDVDGTVEWIKAGTFYASEWDTPSNGISVSFTARDVFEFMIDKKYEGITEGTLREIAESAIAQAELPSDVVVYLDDSLGWYETIITGEQTLATVLQLCANAAGCVMYQDRDGALHIEPIANRLSGHVIRMGWAYSYPEYELSKPLKAVSVTYGDNETYTHDVATAGEVQSVSNAFIGSEGHARTVAQWVGDILKNRKTIRGEFRADPTIDVFDKVTVESKYGVNDAVFLTEIVYHFTGVFKGQYAGRIVPFNTVDAAYCGELYAGEYK